MELLIGKLALVGALGAAAQWLAWRARLPAIVLLLGAGFLAGPVAGWLDPAADFGELLRPLVALAVALILFEGGLSLSLTELRESPKAVQRIVSLGAAIAFAGGACAAHYVAGLSWPSALVLGAILVVTGPTVVIPLLRHARLKPRVASLLRWEAILVDPLGALLAVLVFEAVLVLNTELSAGELLSRVGGAIAWAVIGGWLLGRLLVLAFIRGKVPEFLKAPVVVTAVLVTYALSGLILEESGLLTVTVMGITLGNSRIASLSELRRFKEIITVLLVSGVFVLLTASLELDTLEALTPRDALFVLILLFVVRPVAVLVSTLRTEVSFRERLLAAWIAPRGVVAVAVSGLFAVALAEHGLADADRLVALTFAVVVITVMLHGFTLNPLAKILGLGAAGPDGVLIVGGSPWSTALAKKLTEMELPVQIIDRNWSHLRDARYQGIDVLYGEILSEQAEHQLDLNRFEYLIAATDNDDYNALVCTDFGPEFGRGNVFQIARPSSSEDPHGLAVTLGGRPLLSDLDDYGGLNRRLAEGWGFRKTTLSEDYDESDLRSDTPEEARLMLARRGDRLLWLTGSEPPRLLPDDVVLSFAPEPSRDDSSGAGHQRSVKKV
jgi:NhaP-type Na+/H+ or K+/H+ antiporter